jgi:RimJ/RimL family protein N-acetyltransferase
MKFIQDKLFHISIFTELGFADFKRQIDPSIKGMPELSWAFASHVHGKGYATEGLKAAIAWGDKKFRGTRTVCIINPDNLASIRVATKCDYKEIVRTTYTDLPTIIFAREPRL